MHDLGVHNWGFIAALFGATFVLYALISWGEENVSSEEFTPYGWVVWEILSCLSKVCNIGLGIAVGIEFFMLAHGG